MSELYSPFGEQTFEAKPYSCQRFEGFQEG